MPFKDEESKNIFNLIVILDSLTQVETDSKTGYFWHDKDGQPTENEKEVVERIPVEFPQYRYVETDEDYQTVFNSEFLNNSATDTEIFRKYHIEYVRNKLNEYTELETVTNWDYELIERTEKYLRFLIINPVSETHSPGAIKSKGLSLPEIALICIYTNQHIDSTSSNQILNYFNPNLKSRKKLIDHYNHFQQNGNRIYLTESETKDKNREKLLTRVVYYLEASGLETTKAKNELQILSESINSRY